MKRSVVINFPLTFNSLKLFLDCVHRSIFIIGLHFCDLVVLVELTKVLEIVLTDFRNLILNRLNEHIKALEKRIIYFSTC